MKENDGQRLTYHSGEILADLNWYLDKLKPTDYQSPLQLLSNSSIGQHTRHIIEFYLCLLDQSEGITDPVINYCLRRRDHQIESDPLYAKACIQNIRERLTSLKEDDRCYLNCDEHGADSVVAKSTLGRELVYNIEHTIHHLAIIKIALRHSFPEINIPEHFGVAPSTLHHRQDACAR